MTYFANGIAFDPTLDSCPWLWISSTGECTLEKAVGVLKRAREYYGLLDGWIEKFDIGNNRTIVFRESYINQFGQRG